MGLLDKCAQHTPKDICPKCKWGELILRRGKGYKGGSFYSCSTFPNCSYSYTVENSYGEKAPSHFSPQRRKNFAKNK